MLGLIALIFMLPLAVLLSVPLWLVLSGLLVAIFVTTITLPRQRKRVTRFVAVICFVLLCLASLVGGFSFAFCIVVGANQPEPTGNHFWSANEYCRSSPLRHLYLQ